MTHIERSPLRRRSFIVGASATGLAFGYVAANSIKDALAREENKPYTKIVDNKGWRWEATGTGVDPKKIDLLVKFLENYASGNNAGGLKFKDSK